MVGAARHYDINGVEKGQLKKVLELLLVELSFVAQPVDHLVVTHGSTIVLLLLFQTPVESLRYSS